MTPQQSLVAYARRIAVQVGYPDLARGLQPLARLQAKHLHEQEELVEAEATKSRLHVLHEAADVLYYAACIDVQAASSATYEAAHNWLAARDISPEQAERAALAKYAWRASVPGNKDEAHELRLIAPLLYRLAIFDVDGTLVSTQSGATFRKTASDWQWLPGRLDALHMLREDGVSLAIATNQGGVAFGYLKQEDILRELARMADEAGIRESGLYVCFNHPAASVAAYRFTDIRRKPGPGMIEDAMIDFEAAPNETLMVGDRDEDRQAATSARCDFIASSAFFGD